MIEVEVRTPERCAFLPLSGEIGERCRSLGWMSGVLTLFVPHTTAGITIQENADPDVTGDLSRLLDRLIPWKHADYRHFEGNTAAHAKASLLGSSVQVLVEDMRPKLGRWQEIYFCEFDGPRTRKLWVSFQGYVRDRRTGEMLG